jgi:hypothetical protein
MLKGFHVKSSSSRPFPVEVPWSYPPEARRGDREEIHNTMMKKDRVIWRERLSGI